MDYLFTVHVGYTFHNLPKDITDLAFWETGLHCFIAFLYQMEETLTLTKLHDQVYISP